MLKPVDLQTILPRSVDLQRVQQTQNTRPVIDQQELSRELAQQTQIQNDQVQQSEASAEGNQIVDDALNSNRNRDRRYRRFGSSKKEEEKPEKENLTDPKRGQHIDVTI